MEPNRRKAMNELQRISKEEYRITTPSNLIIVLDNVRSMHNVGSVFRTVDCFKGDAIYLCGVTPQPPHRDIQKTALGATDTVAWKYFETITKAIKELKKQHYKIISIEQVHHSKTLQETELNKNQKYAFVFGNEVTGVSDEALCLSEQCIEIPQLGSKHSFNISVCVGIVLWQVALQLKLIK